MHIYKFGGASTATIERIHTLGKIVREAQPAPMLLVISAMDKTTNALEKVVAAFAEKHSSEALSLFDTIKKQHLETAAQLLDDVNLTACIEVLKDIFTEITWLLHDTPVRHYDYYYDQIVCSGELMSSCIISHYLQQIGIHNSWLDVRDVLRTDNTFRDANIQWEKSAQLAAASIDLNSITVTQGFIGATDENESTTLGREGSDYTAAIFASLLKATSVTIWKDVTGVMNADPKQFSDAVLINQLNYDEVIEMAYYGAQVIHPKTIKPLQNNHIPLYVKCFLDSSLPGTIINNQPVQKLPPIIVVKNNQVILHLQTKDFSFVADEHMIELYQAFNQLHVRPNMIQTGAINVQICVDDLPEKIHLLASSIATTFDVQIEKELHLITIRHYDKANRKAFTYGKKVVLEQTSAHTWQLVYQ